MSKYFEIGSRKLSISLIEDILIKNKKLRLSKSCIIRIKKSRKYLEDSVSDKTLIYGVNTGFGSLCNNKIPINQINKLQENLIISHACGTGEVINHEIVKIILILKIHSLCLGYSGVRLSLVNFLISLFNKSIIPPMFFIALGLLILGNGFFKPNISSFVGTFYKQNSELRDRGFNLFYMGINIGAFLAPITCGAIGQDPNLGVNAWHYGFGLAGIGMVLGLLVFMYGLRTGVFKNNGHSPNPKLLNAKIAALRNEKGEYVGGGMTLKTATYVGTFLLIPVIFFLLSFGSKPLLYPWGKELSFLDIILFSMVGYMIYYLSRYGKKITNHFSRTRF